MIKERSIPNAMDAFFDRHGLIKSWYGQQLGYSPRMFDYVLTVRGFSPEEAADCESLVNRVGRRLTKFRFSADHATDIERLKNEFGIKQVWLAAQLQVQSGSFSWASKQRQSGLTSEEQEVLLAALRDTAGALSVFRLPNSLKKAA